MIGHTSGIVKAVRSAGAVRAAFSIARFSRCGTTLETARGAGDEIIGVFQHATEGAEEVRVMLTGITRLILGGEVAAGDLVKSDGEGRGIAASPGEGESVSVIGRALATGTAGQLIPLLLSQGRIRG